MNSIVRADEYTGTDIHTECANHLQYVQSMEIDPSTGIMWVLDVGRQNIFDLFPDNTCPPKLVLIDIKSGRIIKQHTFADTIANHTSSFLNDIVRLSFLSFIFFLCIPRESVPSSHSDMAR